MNKDKGMLVNSGGTSAVSRRASKSKVRELQSLKYSDGFVADRQLTDRREKRKMEALMSRLYDTQITDMRRKRLSNEEMSDCAAKESQSPIMPTSNSGISDTAEKQEHLSLSSTVKSEPVNEDAFQARPAVSPWAAGRDQKRERRATLHALKQRHIDDSAEKQTSNSMKSRSKKHSGTALVKRRCSTRRASRFGLFGNASGEATLHPYHDELHSPLRQRSTVVASCESLGEFLDAELNDDELIEMEPSCTELQWRSATANPIANGNGSGNASLNLNPNANSNTNPNVNHISNQNQSAFTALKSESASGSQMRITRERSRRESRRQTVRSSTKKVGSKVRKRQLDGLSASCNRVRKPQLGVVRTPAVSRKAAHPESNVVRKRSENASSQRTSLHETAAERTEREERSSQRQAARLACTLYEAVKSENVHLVRQTLHLIANRQDATRIINQLNVDGYSPLHRAAMNDSTSIVRELLKHGAECDVPSRTGSTSLDEAMHRSSTGCIRLLVLAGANLFAPTLHESCEVKADGTTRNAVEFTRTLIDALDHSDQSPTSSINRQLRTVCALSKHEAAAEEHKKQVDNETVELEFSDRPLDDVIVLRESTATAERLYVLADQLERLDAPLDDSFVKRHEAVASLSTQFEFVAPFFDVHRAAQVYDSLAQRSADFCTADELVDDDIANLADYNDALRKKLAIRTRMVSLRSCDHLLRPHLPVNYNALADHDYTSVKRNTPVMIREAPHARSLTSPSEMPSLRQPPKGTRQRRTRKSTRPSFDSNANTTRSALSDIHLMPVTDDMMRPTVHAINTLSDVYVHPSGTPRRLAYHQRLIMPASVTIVENGLPTEKQGVLMFIPFAQQRPAHDTPANTVCETVELDTALSPVATCPDLSLSSPTAANDETETEVNCTTQLAELQVKEHDTTEGAPPSAAKRNEDEESDPLTQRVGTFLSSLCNRVDPHTTQTSIASEQTTQCVVPFGSQRKCVSELLCTAKAKRRSEPTHSGTVITQDKVKQKTPGDEAPELVTFPTPTEASLAETKVNEIMDDLPNTDHVSVEPASSNQSESAEAPACSENYSQQPKIVEQCSEKIQQTANGKDLTSCKPEQHELATIWNGFEMAAVCSTPPACEQPSSSLNMEHDSLPLEGQTASWCNDDNGDSDTNLFALAQKWALSGS